MRNRNGRRGRPNNDQPPNQQAPAGAPYGPPPGQPPYERGRTLPFGPGEGPDAPGYYRQQPQPPYPGDPYAQQPPGDPYAQQPPYAEPGPIGDTNVGVYRAGQQHGPSGLPRLRWKQLLPGVLFHPTATFDRMRDYQVWAPALTVSALYGILVLFGFKDSREQVFSSNFGTLLPILLSGAIAFVLGGLMLGSVTHGLARQLNGEGAWGPTVSMSMLVAWLTDAPRLVAAVFLPADNAFVQVLGWASWLLCAVLLTKMVSKVHDLPWGKAAAASSLQLLALLVLVKLPTLS